MVAAERHCVARWGARSGRDARAPAVGDGLRYEEMRVQPTPSGYVEQHVLRGTLRDGSTLEVPACLVVTVVDGLITRLDEYIDTAGIANL